MNLFCTRISVGVTLSLLVSIHAAGASEYLGNVQRTGYTDNTVPSKPVLRWTYKERHPPRTAWPEPYGELQFIDFDYADQVTIGQGLVYLGSSADHTVRALDAGSGEERWAFYTEGPVRFAPVLFEDRLYAVSDDGHLYCLKASDGSLAWNRRLAPGDERCIGNEQMVSKWPCRSGVLVEGDKLYATAGMWSRDGVIIYCLRADTGEIVWQNDTTGHRWMHLPHGVGYGGVAPQGYLALYKDTLYVTAGRAAPAFLDAKTGELLFHEIGRGYKAHYPGGSWIMAAHDWVMFKRQHNYKDSNVQYDEYRLGPNTEGIIMYNYRTGAAEVALIGGRVIAAALGDDLVLGGGSVIRINAPELRDKYKAHKQVKKIKGSPKYFDPTPLARWETDIGRVYSLMIAGSTIIAGGQETVTLLDAGSGRQLWRRKVEGSVRGISAAGGRFVVSTTSGHLYCFGEGTADSTEVVSHKPAEPSVPAAAKETVSKMVEELGVSEGYCLMLGAGDGSLLFELLEHTELVVYCLEPDPAKRGKMRGALDRAGLLGIRAQLHGGSFDALPYAPYVANCIVWGSRLGSPAEQTDLRGLYRCLRPWGGTACEFSERSATPTTRAKLIAGGVPREEISEGAFGTVVTRGPLPGAGEWTRAHADRGNTLSTEDEVVKLPLGILWWGGVGPSRIVSRHWRAPVPLFAKGHMFIHGQHDIIGVDAYTGREMWNRHIEDVGRFPPAFRGGNIITDGDRVYCVKGLTCYALDAKTGKTVQEYTHVLSAKQKTEAGKLIPAHGVFEKGSLTPLRKPTIVWEYLGMAGGRIIGTLGYDAANLRHCGLAMPHQSRHIFAYDKATGEKAWEITLDNTVSPNAIVSDDKHLYFIDRTDERTYQTMKRKREMDGFSSALRAARLSDGKTVWVSTALNPQRKALFLKNGVIVASANFSDVLKDSTSGLTAFNAEHGRVLWERERVRATRRRGGPVRHVFIVGDTVYTPTPLDLRTGKEKLTYTDPLTGEPAAFKLSGQNFCGHVAAGKHLLAYRSAGIGFRSLTDGSPNYWLPEKRTSCWVSLLPAGGILLSPEGTSTCVCSYNYKTSLALVPVDRHEHWGVYLTGNELPQGGGLRYMARGRGASARPRAFSRLNLNLNAPGDHHDGTGAGPFIAWPQATYPTAKFPMLRVPVEGAEDVAGFRFNSDFTPIAGTTRPWIYASGLTGDVTLKIMGTEEKTCRAVLHFMEPEHVRKGARVFDVLINGKTVLSRFDIVGEAGAPRKALLKEVRGIAPCTTIELVLRPSSGMPPLICGVELIRE